MKFLLFNQRLKERHDESEKRAKTLEIAEEFHTFMKEEYLLLINLMEELLDDNPDFRSTCTEILLSKDYYFLKFETIKFDYSLRYAFFELFDRKLEEKPLSLNVLQQKISIELEDQFHRYKKSNELKTGESWHHFEENFKLLKKLRTFEGLKTRIETNFGNEFLAKEVLKIIVHSLNIFNDLNEIKTYIENEVEELIDSKWMCFLFHNYQYHNWYHINWSDCQYYSIEFYEFNAKYKDYDLFNHIIRLTLVEINTHYNINLESDSVKIVKTSLDIEIPDILNSTINQMKKSELSLSEMSSQIENKMNEYSAEFSWKCYITKNEYFQYFYREYEVSKLYAFRFSQLCVLVLSNPFVNISTDYQKLSTELLTGDDKRIIKIMSQSQKVFYEYCYQLKVIAAENGKMCFVRIHDDFTYFATHKNCNNVLEFENFLFEIYWIHSNDSKYDENYFTECLVMSVLMDESLSAIFPRNESLENDNQK
jgi:hypothetical protein